MAAAASNTGTTAPSSSGLWPSMGANSFSTSLDPNSPTGGYANVSTDVGQGVDTSVNALLPGGYNPSQLGVAQQSTATPDPSSYVTAGQSQMKGPVSWDVTPNQTVAGQFAQLTGQNGGQLNPAIQQAEQASIRSSAAHGGANDLMAQLGAKEVGNNLALSVATTDAATNAAAGQFNATQANAFNQNLNQFVENAQLSGQNFHQALATMNAQTNQQLDLLAAGVNANAANTSIGLKASVANAQVSLNSTLAAMGQNFNYTTAQQFNAAGIANAQQWTQYGMQVRLGYLQGIQTQSNALQQEIANISSNPNITSAQAQGAMSDAINQFNTLTTQLGAYSAAMMPTSETGTASGAYSSAAYNYSYINPTSWPSPSTSTGTSTGGGSSSGNFFLNPGALTASSSNSSAGVAPANNPSGAAAASGGTSSTGGASKNGSWSGNTYTSAGGYSFANGSTGQMINNAVMRGDATGFGNALAQQGYQVSNGQVSDGQGNSFALGDVLSAAKTAIMDGSQALLAAENSSFLAKAATFVITKLFPALGMLNTAVTAPARIDNLVHGTTPIPKGQGGTGNLAGEMPSSYSGNSAGSYVNTGNSNSSSNSLGGSMFVNDADGTPSGDSATSSGLGSPMQGYLGGVGRTGDISEWDGSMGGGNYGGGGGGGGMSTSLPFGHNAEIQ